MTKTSKAEETAERDLHTATTYWADTPRISVRTRAVPSRKHYDVAIIGGGISGALMAEALSDGKRKIVILDRRVPVRGSSVASTAMILHEIDTPLHQLARMIGKSKAERAWRRSARAVSDLDRLVEKHGISAAMERKKALYLAGEEYGARALKTEAESRIAAGLHAVYLDRENVRDTYNIDRTAALASDISASANPAQLTAEFLRVAARAGAEIVSPWEIKDVAPMNGGVAVASAEGMILTADHVVFCTGYEFLERLRSQSHKVISTWAVASKPRRDPPAWLRDHIVWEASDPYLYFRTTPDGRIVAGGEDEDDGEAHADPGKLKSKAKTIARKLKQLTGYDMGEPDYAWAAPFGVTTSGLPIIDKVPGLDNVYAVMGFGGNGITFSKIAADIVSSWITGRADEDADLFRYPG